MHFASRAFALIALALVTSCQGAPPPAAGPAAASSSGANPTVVCEHGCSTGYDACMDAPPELGAAKTGAHSNPASTEQDATEQCRDQLKVCLRRCLN